MNKENKNREIDVVAEMLKLTNESKKYLAIINAATDECDKLSFFADVNRAVGKEQFANGLDLAVKHMFDAMNKAIEKYEKEGK